MRTGNYTRQQIKILRDELNAVYERAEKDLGSISWKEIAQWIEKAFEDLSVRERKALAEPFRTIKTIKLSETDSFRKFCEGKTKEMKPEKMIAIDIWLTQKDNCWSRLTTDKSSRFKDYSKAGASLASYLFKDNSEAPALEVEVLAGEYTGIYSVENEDEGGESEFILKIQKSLTPRILLVDVEEYRTFKESAQSGDEKGRNIEENNLYSGWVTLSPEDNLVCFLKNIESGANSIYYLIAVNESVFDGAKAECLLFLDRQIPSGISEKEESSGFYSYLIEWAKDNQCSLINFQRNPEDV